MTPNQGEATTTGESHLVPVLRPAVFFAQSAVNRFVIFGVLWAVAFAISPIATAGLSGEYLPAVFSVDLDFALFITGLLALFSLVGLGIATLRTWTATVRALDHGLRSNAEWTRAVLAPLHRLFRAAASSFVALVALFLFAFVEFFRVSMQLSGGGLPAFSITWPIAAASVVSAPLALACLYAAAGSLILPVQGSEVRDIEQNLNSSRRIITWTAPFAVVPFLVFALALYLLNTIDWLWLVSWIGLVAPVGLIVALAKVRVAYGRWTDLASRVF